MKVTIAKEVLSVLGLAELTAANSNGFRKQVCAALNGHTVVEIDLADTRSMDCAGLGALIAIRNLTRSRNGAVRLVNPTSPVRQFLDLARATQIFEIVNLRRAYFPGPRATSFLSSSLHLSARACQSDTQLSSLGEGAAFRDLG